MPYGGTTPEQDKKIERCVKEVQGTPNKQTGKPFTKSEAIAVCKSRIIGKENSSAGDVSLAKWTREFINSLPDSSFAVIEPDYKSGKTKDKNARHLPFKDSDGKVDIPHLRNALSRMNQIVPITDSISAESLRSKAKSVLIPYAKKYLPDSQWAKENSREMDLITLSVPIAQKFELVDDTNPDFTLMKFELIDDNEYNGIVFDADAVKHQYEFFQAHRDMVIPHGLDHSRMTLEQLGCIQDMELIEKDGKVKCNIISKIFKQTQAQKEARILFEQGLLNYISGGWSGRIVFVEDTMKFHLQKPRLREVSSTPTPAKDDAKLLEVLNSLRPSPEEAPITESEDMTEDNKENPPSQEEGQKEKEQGAEFSALKEKTEQTAKAVAQLVATQEAEKRSALIERAGELGLSAELFKDMSNKEIEFALKVSNEAVVVALRGKTPTTQLGGETQAQVGPEPETIKQLMKDYYNW